MRKNFEIADGAEPVCPLCGAKGDNIVICLFCGRS